MEVLFCGKFNLRHVPLIEELMHRDILKKPVLPNHFGKKDFQQKLHKLRSGLEALELLN